MTSETPWFSSARFEAERQAHEISWGEPLVALDSTSSTNDLALDAERDGAPEGATFLAREQTRGRGRRDNGWWSAPGDNLTCSLLLRPELEAARVAALPLVVGLAVREVVARRLEGRWAAPPVLVKWPNDVWVGSRKIAGILVESRLRGDIVSAAIVGIGLNVRTLDFPEELAGRATSLDRELGRRKAPIVEVVSKTAQDLMTSQVPHTTADEATSETSLEELLVELLESLTSRYERLRSSGFGSFVPELDVCDALRGRYVRTGDVEGTATGVSATGALRVVDTRGVQHLVHAGHVEIVDEGHRPPPEQDG